MHLFWYLMELFANFELFLNIFIKPTIIKNDSVFQMGMIALGYMKISHIKKLTCIYVITKNKTTANILYKNFSRFIKTGDDRLLPDDGQSIESTTRAIQDAG